MYRMFSGFDSSPSLLFRVYEIIQEVSFFCLIYYFFWGVGEKEMDYLDLWKWRWRILIFFNTICMCICVYVYMCLKDYVSLLFSLQNFRISFLIGNGKICLRYADQFNVC